MFAFIFLLLTLPGPDVQEPKKKRERKKALVNSGEAGGPMRAAREEQQDPVAMELTATLNLDRFPTGTELNYG